MITGFYVIARGLKMSDRGLVICWMIDTTIQAVAFVIIGLLLAGGK